MKRRNVEIGKMRRPMKRNKITEGIYGSTLLYLKFLLLWVLVILADFILEFRFEFLWPFYLLLRSVYDSFKYQGLAFSIFFILIALTSDMLCYFFIPVHWLFFAASTYVWVQYVWHTDKGICAPTIILWILFVYLEAAIRLKDIKHMPGHLDLCRPFAAHCIGYPVVTLGFGFKSYIGYRIRQRKQRDVAKENEFYMQLMLQALPPQQHENILEQQQQQKIDNHTIVPANVVVQNKLQSSNNFNNNNNLNNINNNNNSKNGHLPNNCNTKINKKIIDKCNNKETAHDEHHTTTIKQQKLNHINTNGNIISCNFDEDIQQQQQQQQDSKILTNNPVTQATRKREKKEQDKEREANEYLQKLESDNKKLRLDLQNSRASEQELRLQVATLTTSEKVSKGELTAMQREIEELQQRIQNINNSRASDKQTINSYERRINDERRIRCNLESQLNQERKNRKEEARAAQVAAQTCRIECTETCKLRRRDLDKELQECRHATHIALERCSVLEREKNQIAEKLRDTDLLLTALSALQEKNQHLENSLSAETRIKLDLFSALGEAKRQIEIRECSNRNQEKEIEELRSKIAQVLAVMPNDSFGGSGGGGSVVNNGSIQNGVIQMSRVRLTEAATPGSTLDPNATAYTPKGSLVASTEA